MDSYYLLMPASVINANFVALTAEHERTDCKLSVNWRRDGSQGVVKLTTQANSALLASLSQYVKPLADVRVVVSAADWKPVEVVV